MKTPRDDMTSQKVTKTDFEPLLSVICISYNQEEYIAQTLEGFLMQETSFPIEIIIHDDASSDKTANIIRDYESRFDDMKKIKPIYEDSNQYSTKGNDFINDMLNSAQGKYIAVCEGDDYWTDPNKLQSQIDFLEKNTDYSICFHKVRVVHEKSDKADGVYPDVDDEAWYTFKELLNINYIPTASAVYRKKDYGQLLPNIMPGDWYFSVYHAHDGKIKIIDKIMAVYRKHDKGIWHDFDENRDLIWQKYGLSYIKLYTEFLRLVKDKPKKYKDIVEESLNSTLASIARVDKKFGEHNLKLALDDHPEYALPFMYYLSQRLTEAEEQSQKHKTEWLKLGDEKYQVEADLARDQARLKEVEQELAAIKGSFLGKNWNRLAHVKKKIKPSAKK